VAKQAGYTVFEINARLIQSLVKLETRMLKFDFSDARSAQVVEERIRPAVEVGYTIGSTRPNLVIIDEIDGATGGGDNVR
jgi:chromosome transmission fidelity protein 18